MADPFFSGLIGSAALIAMLGVNALLLWHYGPRLAAALGLNMAGSADDALVPDGEPVVVQLRPRSTLRAVPASPLRLAA